MLDLKHAPEIYRMRKRVSARSREFHCLDNVAGTRQVTGAEIAMSQLRTLADI